ncbi:MAG: hypothetical protein M3R36_09000 [Bacteroidota bacterium]|nr:hypothetical protein [Bacteroidota bacterium]
MSNQIQYLIDKKGRKTSVIVPYTDWKELNDNYRKLYNKVKILTGIKEGIFEVRDARNKVEQLQSLTEFLDESRS